MRMLIVAHRFPWPLHRGDTLTVYKMAEYFGARHEVDLLCHASGEAAAHDRLRPLVRRLETVTFSRAAGALRVARALASPLPLQVAWCGSGPLRQRAAELVRDNDYDVVLAYYVRPAEALRRVQGPAKVIAMQLSMALQWDRAARQARWPWQRLVRGVEARRLRRYESQMFRAFDRCLLISKHDLAHVHEPIPEKVVFNPHGVDVDRYAPDAAVAHEPRRIIFTGLMSFQPNVDAACHFAREILPRVLERVPEAQFMIVGHNPAPAVRSLAQHPAITVTGSVPDIAAYLRTARLAVDPLRIGAGLQNKVLEALSTGVPMVMSGLANEGIGAVHGEHGFVADDPQAFAEHVVNLLTDDGLRQRVSDAARQWICEQWTWEYHFQRLDEALAALVEPPQPAVAQPV